MPKLVPRKEDRISQQLELRPPLHEFKWICQGYVMFHYER